MATDHRTYLVADAADRVLAQLSPRDGASDTGGVQASTYRNKMNELKPHRNWALRVIDRAAAFGVTRQGVSFVDLLTALASPGSATS